MDKCLAYPIGNSDWDIDDLVAKPTLYAIDMDEIKTHLHDLAARETKMSADVWGTPEDVDRVFDPQETFVEAGEKAYETLETRIAELKLAGRVARDLAPCEFFGYSRAHPSFPSPSSESVTSDPESALLDWPFSDVDGGTAEEPEDCGLECEWKSAVCDSNSDENPMSLGEISKDPQSTYEPIYVEENLPWRGHKFL